MNQIYRVIFNHATGVYQCVSEFAKAKGKTKSVKAITVAIGLAISGQALSANAPNTPPTIVVNGSNTIINQDGTISQDTLYDTFDVYIGYETGNSANVNVQNGAILSTKGNLHVGSSGGTGKVAVNNATINSDKGFVVGHSINAKDTPFGIGEVIFDNKSKLITNNGFSIAVHQKDSKLILQGGSTATTTNKLNINPEGTPNDTQANVIVRDTETSLNANIIEVGRGSHPDYSTNPYFGVVEISNGATTNTQQIWLGDFKNGTGIINVLDKGSILNATDTAIVGNQGTGTINLKDGGSALLNKLLLLGYSDGGNGTMRVTGTDSQLTVNDHAYIAVGAGSKGELVIQNTQADNHIKGELSIGVTKDATGSVLLDNANLNVSGKVKIGYSGNGEMTVTNNSLLNVPTLEIGAYRGQGKFYLKDSTLDVNQIAKYHEAQSSLANFNHSIININNPTDPLFKGFTNTDTISLTNNVTFNTAKDTAIDSNARLTGTGNFIKEGTGTLSMNVASKAWTGETHIDKGILELNGDYTMRAGEVLAVAVNDGANDYGKLAVKGNADIDKGTLKVKASDLVKSLTTGTTPTGEWKDVVTATSLVGAKNEFATFTVVDKDGNAIANNANIVADYSETNAGKVHLKVEASITPPPPPPPTPTPTPKTGDFVTATTNQSNTVSAPIAQVLDHQIANPTPDNANLVTAVTLGGSSLDEKGRSQAVSELQPLFMGAVNRILHDNQSNLDNIVHHHKIDRNSDLWVTGFGSRSSHDHRNSVAGYETDEKGIVIGADKIFDKTRLGVALAITDIDGKTTDTVQHDLDVLTLSGLLYGDYAVNDKTTLTAQANIGKANIDGIRHIKTLADTRAAADYQADILGAGLGISQKLGNDKLRIIPFAKLDYQSIKSDAYRETGAGVYDLVVEKNTQNILKASVGINAKTKLNQNLALTGQLALGVQTGDRENDINASFATTPNTHFTTIGHKASGFMGSANLGLTYTPTPTSKIGLHYQGEWRGSFNNQGVVVELEKRF